MRLSKALYEEARGSLDSARRSVGVELHPRGLIRAYVRGNWIPQALYPRPYVWITERGKAFQIVFFQEKSPLPTHGEMEYWESQYDDLESALNALAVSLPKPSYAEFAEMIMRVQTGLGIDADENRPL